MTMTSVAVAPGSLGAPPAMLTPTKRYHLQPGLSQNSSSPTPAKDYDPLSKGKKSWSVRLGLSRQSHRGVDDPGKGWGTISGGSALSRQMLYGDPWLYGTVRSSRGIHDPRGYLNPPPPPLPGAPVLVVCSCPEFLIGTTRKLGNCRKCGGHRLAGVPLGGTCRIATTSSRSRPSLAGILRSSIDDPYDVMRRSRLVEPRSRARSISPHRQTSQRDSRSQSVVRSNKDRKIGSTEVGVSRTEWFDNETSYEENSRQNKSRPSFAAGASSDDWLEETRPEEEARCTNGRVVRVANKKGRNWQDSNGPTNRQDNARRNKGEDDWKDGQTLNNNNNSNKNNNNNNNNNSSSSSNNNGISSLTDSRKSILECDVNPYLLVKKQMTDEDDLSDDLSDNALELEEKPSSSLFDPSKVKSIERVPNRSAVAAIGGQRIRVFNEPREISDDETETESIGTVTRIPIPKISPKRPPRRMKEPRTTLKSILKRGKPDGKRKNVLFNVNNVIFAPEKPPEMNLPNGRRSSRVSINSLPKEEHSCTEQQFQVPQVVPQIVPQIVHQQHLPERPKFITIPNIRDPKRTTRVQEPKIIPEVKINPDIERMKMEQSTIARRPEVPVRNSSRKDNLVNNKTILTTDTTCSNEETRSLLDSTITELSIHLKAVSSSTGEIKNNASVNNASIDKTKNNRVSSSETSLDTIRPEDETEFEIEIEELEHKIPLIENEDEQLILKSGDENGRRACLSRSQSDRTSIRPETTAGSVNYLDTMRLSLRRKVTDVTENGVRIRFKNHKSEAIPEVDERTERARDLSPSSKIDRPEMRAELREKEDESASLLRSNDGTRRNDEHFRRMRPTSWSPPPGKSKHRDRASDPGPLEPRNPQNDNSSGCCLENWREIGSNRKNAPCRSCSFESSSRVEIINARPKANVCKITVSPRASPLIHRLRINGNEATSQGARRTSIMINGEQNPIADSSNNNRDDNKVTISVGGEDSVCNPTVISVNSSSPPKIQSSSENRTLVILENYRSNIVLESMTTREDHSNNSCLDNSRAEDARIRCEDSVAYSSPEQILPKTIDRSLILKRRGGNGSVKFSSGSDEERNNFCKNDQKSRFRDIDSNGRWSSLSKESLISKLLEDSLRKARENGEILDESSGEAILRILKQSLLKNKDYESSESTIEPEPSYSRSPSLNSDTDFVSTNLFLEENPYEVIKEPIYEEIPDEPPPLPLSPPPTEDYIKDRIYFAQEYKEAYYKKVNAGQFLRSYLSEDIFKKTNDFKHDDGNVDDSYLSKSPEEFFKKIPTNANDPNFTTKFELLNFLMDSKDRSVVIEEDDEVEDDDEEDDDEEDTEGDLEALYEQKETSMGDLSSKSSQISNVSDSSEECNIILTSSPEALKTRTVDIERTDSGVGSESSQASSSRGITRRWRSGNVSSGPASLLCEIPQVISGDTKLCEDCEQRLEPLITDSGVVYAPFVCRKCSKKRAERKEIITEIVETEQKYGRDLQIILEEFHRPMLRAGLLTQEQLAAIFLNVEELLEHNLVLAEKLKDAVEFSQVSGDEDLVTVDVGKIFLESERMLHAFESYCTRQGGASLLLQNLEKEKELLRIFLKVSQMENTVLRRMNLNSFLMVPVQRVTKYPLLLARLLKATPAVRIDVHEVRKRLEQARANIELHLEHMNAEAKDLTSTKLWRRISIIQNGRRSNGEQDMVNIKLRKMAVEVLEWAHEEARFVLEGRLLVAQPTDNNWRRGRTVKLAPVTAMLVTNGKPSVEFLDSNDDSLFPRQIGIKEATLLLVKEKIGRYSLLREPLYLDKCIVCCETDLEDYFEIQELSSKETFIFKAEDGARTKRWCRTLQAHAQSLGAWRRRRGALPNIMICGVARS